ncbi:hypothetical protein EG834_14155, partial [bacterium]|nr:hypothetical protein [bacterium]
RPVFNIGAPELSICGWFSSDDVTKVAQMLFNTVPHRGIALTFNHFGSPPNSVAFLLGPCEPADWHIGNTPGIRQDYLPNTWYHFAFTKNEEKYALYVNGEREATQLDPLAKSYNYNVGYCIGNIDPDYGSETFLGCVDDFRIYNRALSDAEVKALYEGNGSYLTNQPLRVRTDLVQTSAWLPSTNAVFHKAAASASRAIVMSGDSEVRLLDLRNPSAPVTLGTWSTLLPLSDAVLVGNLAYLASWEADVLSTVEIVDFTDPAKPVLKGYYDTPGYAQELLLRGNIMYVADAEGGLTILDVGDPANPQRTGGYDTKGSVQHVEVHGNYACTPDGNWLIILDVSDPTNPRRVGLYEVTGGIASLKAYGTKLYLSEGSGAVRILEVTNPASIQLLGTYQGWGNPAQAMAVSGRYLY